MDQSLSEGAGPELLDSELVALGREGKGIASSKENHTIQKPLLTACFAKLA